MDGNNNIKAPPKDETNKSVICIDDEAQTEGVPLNTVQVLPQTRGRPWIMGKRPDVQHLSDQFNKPDDSNNDDREERELRCYEHYPDNPTKHSRAHQ